MLNENSETFIVISQAEAGERLDKVLAARFSAYSCYSRSYFQELIEQQLVLLNGDPVKKRMKLSAGDEVEIEFALRAESQDIKPEKIELDIIFEDEYIMAVNKPAGMVVHPAAGNWDGTFVNAFLYHCSSLTHLYEADSSTVRPGIVHRLDKDTTGVLIAAKTLLAQQRLIALFASRSVYKEYCAICVGDPAEGIVQAPIGRHPTDRKRMAVTAGGKPAHSVVSKLFTNGSLSIVKVILATGRTHQIRVHLQHLGTPILGDIVYGNSQANKKYGVCRQMLHARFVRLTHPITGEEIHLEAPLPGDMSTLMNKIRP